MYLLHSEKKNKTKKRNVKKCGINRIFLSLLSPMFVHKVVCVPVSKVLVSKVIVRELSYYFCRVFTSVYT